MLSKGGFAEMDVSDVSRSCLYETASSLPPAFASIRYPRLAWLTTGVRSSGARKNTEVGGEVNFEGSVGHL